MGGIIRYGLVSRRIVSREVVAGSEIIIIMITYSCYKAHFLTGAYSALQLLTTFTVAKQ